MDEITLLSAGACIILAALVYMMWKSATKEEWQALTHDEKVQWRVEEEKRREGRHS